MPGHKSASLESYKKFHPDNRPEFSNARTRLFISTAKLPAKVLPENRTKFLTSTIVRKYSILKISKFQIPGFI